MHKGFGTKEIIEECKRLDETHMDYNFFYLAGIYGSDRGEVGAKNTAKVFNQVHPKIIVSSMLTIYPTSELYQEIQDGNGQRSALGRVSSGTQLIEQTQGMAVCFS